MKLDSVNHLRRLASAELWNGGTRALDLATRAKSLTGSSVPMEIISGVYSNFDRFKLARLASSNCWNGGASALAIAKRIDTLAPGADAVEIVSRVYSRSDGKAIFECRDCGCQYLTEDSAADCCGPDAWEDCQECTGKLNWEAETAGPYFATA